ncbi:effector-associated constant component EACC1 [Pseudofrankia inefficax]|uniref:Uncharacterized protein n=1 Tax=Pseudofrankia inefficax (strain DSM 45817 / CECT 9037 / DDB 130130 / EuI1c) TaxID=298654 RepID=E3J1F2_PSEI1|nr:hypothetical protein [Pseudofrankia inefficax]ADP80473.1 hypothetical protein FraEuI1c_2438 [Pseudofrankia inefficax]
MATTFVISAADAADLLSLRTWLRRVNGLEVKLSPTAPSSGEQGAGWDVLSVVAGSGGVGVAMLATIKSWIESRRSSLRIRVKDSSSEREIELDAENIDDVMPLLKKMLDG